jgi:uncharacterized protein YecE (DUF72 family)
MSTPPLFDERPPFDRQRLADRVARLAAERILIGTSSWRYEGWLGQIYTRERYLSRGVFSQKLFEAGCLAEYASTFPIVCGDFSFYQFPTPEFWRRLFGSAPETLRYAFKAPEQVTAKVFPSQPRYGEQGGTVNRSFLDAGIFEDQFLAPLEPYRERVAVLILEFGTFSQSSYPDARAFVADLDRFLARLPHRFRYSVEIRNAEFLTPEYFQCLAAHGIAHVFNSWTRMPALAAQLQNPEAFTADYTVCRALLRPGRSYADAVKLFSPYEQIQDPNPDGRQAIRQLIEWAKQNRAAAFIFVNNRFEGNAPRTIEAVVE